MSLFLWLCTVPLTSPGKPDLARAERSPGGAQTLRRRALISGGRVSTVQECGAMQQVTAGPGTGTPARSKEPRAARPRPPHRGQALQLYHSSSESCQSANKRQRRLLFPWPQVSNTGWIKTYCIVSDGECGWSSGKSSQWCFFFIVILWCWVLVVAARWGTGDGRLAGPAVTWPDTVNISQRSWIRNETFTLLSRPRTALGDEGNLRWIMTVYDFNDCHEWMPSFVVDDNCSPKLTDL